jgi:hypothetical protein
VIRCSGFVPLVFCPCRWGALVFDRRRRQGQAARLAEKFFCEFEGWGVPRIRALRKIFRLTARLDPDGGVGHSAKPPTTRAKNAPAGRHSPQAALRPKVRPRRRRQALGGVWGCHRSSRVGCQLSRIFCRRRTPCCSPTTGPVRPGMARWPCSLSRRGGLWRWPGRARGGGCLSAVRAVRLG